MSSLLQQESPETDAIHIRGVRLPLAELVDRRLFEPECQAALREKLLGARPFPHLVVEGIFNPLLLDLVREEFDTLGGSAWMALKNQYENTRRSALGARLGAASQLYFDIVYSGWFSQWVSSITNVPYLLPDPRLFGGGLHESRAGAHFAVHRDFRYHRFVGLKNEMVFITYLNKDWRPEWGGALELWDAQCKRCETHVQPEFGHSILMLNSPGSYHGHPTPLQAPEDQHRRSIAAYYYTSPMVGGAREDEVASTFLRTSRMDRAKTMARLLTPPLFWSAARRFKRRS
ncbi:MAG: hypothetical protein JWQ03_2024 [Variovorax sp.]|nr:hypothetical protein [Variovorax sp.]